jgi:H+/Cl- antiporter ClcA
MRFKRTGIFAAIGALVIFVLVGAANGVLGELGVTVFQWLQQLAGSLITVSSLPWLIIVLILIAALVSLLVIWQRDKYTLDTTNRIVDLDNWLQRYMYSIQ